VYKESFLSRVGVSSSVVFTVSGWPNFRIAERLNTLFRYSVLVAIVFVVFTIFTTS
jgi:hypothetical protein